MQTPEWGTSFHKWYEKSYGIELNQSRTELYYIIMNGESDHLLEALTKFNKEVEENPFILLKGE